jgi:sugar lactone lactonase YvrE
VEKSFRSEICDYSNPPVEKPQYEHICGRPLGLRFNKKTGELFIADGYFGLMKVAPDGGLAEPVVQEFDGVQFKFLNSLDFDEDGIIYFTDSSSKYYRRFV